MQKIKKPGNLFIVLLSIGLVFTYVQQSLAETIVMFYTISNDATGGDCASIGIWDNTSMTCMLTQDISARIAITGNGITFDGDGHTLVGDDFLFVDQNGVEINGYNNVTVSNLNMQNITRGLRVTEANNILVDNVHIDDVGGVGKGTTEGWGIVFDRVTNSNIIDSSVTKPTENFFSAYGGIHFQDSSYNRVEDNFIEGPHGISLGWPQQSQFNLIKGNTISAVFLDGAGMYITIERHAEAARNYYNKIYNNNFIAYSAPLIGSQLNELNIGLPFGGNYWYSFDEVSEGCNDIDDNFICDDPLLFDVQWADGEQDNYPWTEIDGWEKRVENVTIDILPGSQTNCFNNDGHGIIPVAIFSGVNFDATQIDSTTVMLDGQMVRVVGKGNLLSHIEDVNADGIMDLMVQIEDADGVYKEGAGVGTMTGITNAGQRFIGSDLICIL